MFDAVSFLPARIDPDTATGYSFGVLDRDGAPIGAFHEPWWDMRPAHGDAEHRSGSFIYGGSLLNHFGHFLLDSLPRVWAMRQRPELPVLWHVDPSIPDPWPSWMEQIWQVLGLHRHAHLVIRSPMSVDRVFLPDSGRQSIHVLHPVNAAALSVHRADRPFAGDHVWFSRRGLAADQGRVEREEELEGVLSARGWTIVRPEALAVAEQVDFFMTAAVVAGFIGSAFHSVLLAEAPRARLLLVQRPGLGHENYDAVARARRLRQTYVAADFERHEQSGPGVTFTLAEPGRLADAICEQARPD
jgi:capsular polysaccharide biosynthesis protein